MSSWVCMCVGVGVCVCVLVSAPYPTKEASRRHSASFTALRCQIGETEAKLGRYANAVSARGRTREQT